MTGKDLLTAMSGIYGRYIEEAAPAAAPKTRSLRRPLLVAAAIAAALLLVGCGIVYALRPRKPQRRLRKPPRKPWRTLPCSRITGT